MPFGYVQLSTRANYGPVERAYFQFIKPSRPRRLPRPEMHISDVEIRMQAAELDAPGIPLLSRENSRRRVRPGPVSVF